MFQRLKLIYRAVRIFQPLLSTIKFVDWLKLLYWKEQIRENKNELYCLHLKRNIGGFIYIRKNSYIDREVLKCTFINQYHIPPFNLPNDAIILDIGSNIGLTILHYKLLYPNCKILGYEMDKDNFELASKNCAQLANCTIVNKAVWYTNTIVSYDSSIREDGYSISDSDIISNNIEIESITLQDILKENQLTHIDFLKMDIEGAEKDILLKGDKQWMNLVRAMHIEIHDNSFFDSAMSILTQQGFYCQKDNNHWCAIFAQKNINH